MSASSKRGKEEIIWMLDTIISKMPGHVFWKDLDCHLLGCNDNQANLLGLSSRHDIVGRSNYDMLIKNQSEEEKRKQASEIDKNDRQVMASGESQMLEEPLFLSNGTVADYLSIKEPLYDKEGNISGLLGISIDITDKKRSEALAKKLEIQEQVTQKTKLWAGAIAHEVRTPLAALDLSASDISEVLEAVDEHSTKEELLNVINSLKSMPDELSKSLDRAHNVVDMTLMKAKSNIIQDIVTQKMSIHSAVSEAISSYPLKDDEKELIHLDIDETVCFQSNQDYFEHVMFNLLKNALYFIKKARKGEIFISARLEDNHTVLTFKDTAMGVDEATLKQFFTLFFTKSQNGTGVGLNLCQNVIEALGGAIEAQSKLGEHMTFEMRFPRV